MDAATETPPLRLSATGAVAATVLLLLVVSTAPSAAASPGDTSPAPLPRLYFDVVVYGATSGGVTAAIAASRHRLPSARRSDAHPSDPHSRAPNYSSNYHARAPGATPATTDYITVGLIVAIGGGCGPGVGGVGDPDHIGGMSSGGLSKTDIGAGAGLIGGIAGEFYSRCAAAYNTTAPPHYDHEPHVAREAFEGLLTNSSVVLLRGGHAANIARAEKNGTRIVAITLADGRRVEGRAFIDASCVRV